jgi:hypothetical protein
MVRLSLASARRGRALRQYRRLRHLTDALLDYLEGLNMRYPEGRDLDETALQARAARPRFALWKWGWVRRTAAEPEGVKACPIDTFAAGPKDTAFKRGRTTSTQPAAAASGGCGVDRADAGSSNPWRRHILARNGWRLAPSEAIPRLSKLRYTSSGSPVAQLRLAISFQAGFPAAFHMRR